MRARLEKFQRRMTKVNRIYIMPSGRGALFLGVIVVMILTAASYNNNLIFVLAFFLFALFIVSMLQTHYNLKSVRADFVATDEAFEGEPIRLMFHLNQKRARKKEGLELRSTSREFKTMGAPREAMGADERVRAVKMDVLAARRGLHPVPQVVLETYWPLGLFRAWKVFRPQGTMLIYPRREGQALLPHGGDETGEDETGASTSPDGDFGELKDYREGESYRQIAWKHFARTGDLYTKVHWGANHRHYALRWQPPPRAEAFEAYLRQLSLWIDLALKDGATFELETPGLRLESGRGIEHARACWRALAALKGAA